MSPPLEPNKSRVSVEPNRSRVPGRWPRQAVASRSRVMGSRSWQSGHVPKHYNTPKVQSVKKPPPKLDKTIHNPKKAQGTWYQTTPGKGVLDIEYSRCPYPGHGIDLGPFRHGRRAIRERPIGERLSPRDRRQKIATGMTLHSQARETGSSLFAFVLNSTNYNTNLW